MFLCYMKDLNEEYVCFYNLTMKTLGNKLIPDLNRDKILAFLSKKNWLIIPTLFESDKKQAINRPDPNIFFRIDVLKETMEVGLVYNTIESINRFRNIISPFQETERIELISKLKALDNRFKVTVNKKIYRYFPLQSPEYEKAKEWQSNSISEEVLKDIFQCSRDIRQEGLIIKEKKGLKWTSIRPSIDLASVEIRLDKSEFIKVLNELKPIYELVLKIKTDKEINGIKVVRKKNEEEQKQAKFREFVEDLKRKCITGEEYRKRVAEWRKKNVIS